MVQRVPPSRPRPPALRIALIAAMCGAAVGLGQVGERRAPPLAPSALDSPGEETLAIDLRYRVALFAYELARRSGVPGVAEPTSWEEAAIADYERLALGPEPPPAACHRLGLIYARRGYLRQAREMLTRAVTRDDGAGEVYWALLLVYSQEPIRARDVSRLREELGRQPRWLALWSLADLARRVDLPDLAAVYETQARREVDRLGLYACLLAGAGAIVVCTATVVVLLLALRGLFRRGREGHPWPATLPAFQWLDVLDVAALAAFCNALGQAGREGVAGVIPPGSTADTALRAAHAVLALGPPLALVIARARRGRLPWPRALGLASQGLGRHLLQGVVGLGVALGGAVVLRDVLLTVARIGVPGLDAGALGARATPSPEAVSVVGEIVLIALLAPVLEEIIFRGFVFRALLDHLRPLAAAGLSALLFAGAHLAWAPQAFIPLLALGLVSAYVYQYSRSLIPCILLHAGYNAAILLAGLVLRM